MSDFKVIKIAVMKNIETLIQTVGVTVFRANVSKDDLWETYLKSFPAGTDPIFRERTEHDCQCCKQFIRAIGGMVFVVDGELKSIWSVDIYDTTYTPVANALAKLVIGSGIKDPFIHYEASVGTDHNHDNASDDIVWNHFYTTLPAQLVLPAKDIDSIVGEKRTTKEVFKRGLDEITIESAEVVLDLIAQNSLYRGADHTGAVERFVGYKRKYDALQSDIERELFAWSVSINDGMMTRTRASVIGTLLVDLSDGKPLEDSVKMFEVKVAPTNYKRPKALITQKMIDQAQTKIQELGLEPALGRRYAVQSDITINNVLFADRSVKATMNVFDDMKQEVGKRPQGNLDRISEVSIDTFIADILPNADSVEVMMENSHTSNLMSLVAPSDPDAGNMFQWDNNFSWSYNGEVADSIKERVRKAGGRVDAVLRTSLSWFNTDDLDIHAIEPCGKHIYFGDKCNPRTSGQLDIDMNAGCCNHSRNAVENIVWTDAGKMEEGEYQIYVHNFSKRETIDVGFDVEMEFDGVLHSFHYDKPVSDDEKVQVVKFNYSRAGGIKITESLPSSKSSKNIWGVDTNMFHKVSTIMHSPNFWDGKKNGNKHVFFMLDGCHNEGNPRGFYNEFLRGDLTQHRKVFEVLGNKMCVADSDEQLSGLGFSSTQRNSVICKVTGSFTRTIKINF